MVTREEMTRVLNGFMRDVSRQTRSMQETMVTEIKTLTAEIASIKKSCQVQKGYTELGNTLQSV